MQKQRRQLLLVFIAYHSSSIEVDRLEECLGNLPVEIGYALFVNDYKIGEPVERLKPKADYLLVNKKNLGYGCAANKLISSIGDMSKYVGVLNTDITWPAGCFEVIIEWMNLHPDVALVAPQILNERGEHQKLCKRNPTLLALISRRFFIAKFKPNWLKRYDYWYAMWDKDYMTVFEVPYLSGCCMVMRCDNFFAIGGFDERFFLYFEDADITRRLSVKGKCVHLPFASVTHGWGRGSYKSISLTFVNIVSAGRYFLKWGIRLW